MDRGAARLVPNARAWPRNLNADGTGRLLPPSRGDEDPLGDRAIGQNPVSVLFTVLDHQQTPNNKLAELYNWRPSGGRKVHPVEMPDDKSAPRSGQGRMIE
jgi:hypothetical protein